MREHAQELKAAARHADKVSEEREVVTKIAAMAASDRAMAERLHAIIKASAPGLSPKLWYGMPAYAKDGAVICFFQAAQKFKTRYATFGFNGCDSAKSLAQRFMIREGLLFEAVGFRLATAFERALQSNLRWNVEHEGEVRHGFGDHDALKRADHRGGDLADDALIDTRGIDKPIAHHPLAALNCGADDQAEVLVAGGREQDRFGVWPKRLCRARQ